MTRIHLRAEERGPECGSYPLCRVLLYEEVRRSQRGSAFGQRASRCESMAPHLRLSRPNPRCSAQNPRSSVNLPICCMVDCRLAFSFGPFCPVVYCLTNRPGCPNVYPFSSLPEQSSVLRTKPTLVRQLVAHLLHGVLSSRLFVWPIVPMVYCFRIALVVPMCNLC
jgi:hypothetical protein